MTVQCVTRARELSLAMAPGYSFEVGNAAAGIASLWGLCPLVWCFVAMAIADKVSRWLIVALPPFPMAESPTSVVNRQQVSEHMSHIL